MDEPVKVNPENEKFLKELGRASCDLILGYVTKRLGERLKDKFAPEVKPEIFRLPIVSRVDVNRFLSSDEGIQLFIERFVLCPGFRMISSISNYNQLVFGNCQVDIFVTDDGYMTMLFSVGAAKKPA